MATIDIPVKLLPIITEKHRYKVLFGGRGGAKSWGVARALLVLGAQAPIRVLCAREVQRTIRDSVHRLLSDQIGDLGLAEFYDIGQAEIRGGNGTLFLFSGLQSVDNLKSYEGVTHCWVEEAQNVTKASWEKLIPTIRVPGSEIWLTFNPLLETDETYQRFIVNTPPGSLVIKVDWRDNPWFPDVLQREMEHLKKTDHDAWLNVWEGHCRQTLDGAIYAQEIRVATEQGRITAVPVDARKPVQTFWDLGRADMTSIWFAQQVGFEYRMVDFHQDSGKSLSHYLKILQNKGYLYGEAFLPHDAKAKLLASDKTIERQVQDAGFRVRVLPATSIHQGINSARELFPRIWFDQARCSDGLQALRHYRYDVDERTGQQADRPLHDVHSHAADAFRYFAVAMREPRKPVSVSVRGSRSASGWMG